MPSAVSIAISAAAEAAIAVVAGAGALSPIAHSDSPQHHGALGVRASVDRHIGVPSRRNGSTSGVSGAQTSSPSSICDGSVRRRLSLRGDTTGMTRAASRCTTLHHARITCIMRAPSSSRCITYIKPASPASNLHHLHHACITRKTLHQPCINPSSAAHGLHHAH